MNHFNQMYSWLYNSKIVKQAASMNDFDEALACIQDVLDIDGSMAGEYFDDYDRKRWWLMLADRRRLLLDGYIAVETYLDDDNYLSTPQYRQLIWAGRDRVRRQFNDLCLSKPLSTRALNCLASAEILSLRELTETSEAELLKTPNLGKKTVAEIKGLLGEINLTLREETQ